MITLVMASAKDGNYIVGHYSEVNSDGKHKCVDCGEDILDIKVVRFEPNVLLFGPQFDMLIRGEHRVAFFHMGKCWKHFCKVFTLKNFKLYEKKLEV